MRKAALVFLVLALVVAAGCGGDNEGPTKTGVGGSVPTVTATEAEQTASGCPRVRLGVREGDAAATYATVENPTAVDCATATVVVREWARQQVGLGDASLPPGWACDSSSVCRKGDSRVEMVLEFPQ